ncbi:MAG: ParB/RepB/Spo0J family partition protein [bacterium]
MKSRSLGKGLRALIAESEVLAQPTGQVAEIEVTRIEPNPVQARQVFDSGSIEELKQSIITSGLLQPILVRRHGEKYQIVVGERRWRASREAGLERIPARIIEVGSDREMLELSLLENVQREDLNPIELSEAFRRLQTDCQMTQEQIAERVGKSRTHVANILRLLKLPEEIKESIRKGELTMGHARALLTAKDDKTRLSLHRRFLADEVSVRTAEELVRVPAAPSREPKGSADVKLSEQRRRSYFARTEERLRRRLSTRIKIRARAQGGTIELDFYSDSDLERLVELIEGEG